MREALATGRITHVSLVPTMLDRLMPLEAPALKALLLGGGPIPADQLELRPAGRPHLRHDRDRLGGAWSPVSRCRASSCASPRTARSWCEGRWSAADGWLATGDLGSLDDTAASRCAGRKADTIITGGENVSPRYAWRQALESHPGVVEAGVTGRPDPEWGEAVVAFVVGEATEAELLAHARERLARARGAESCPPCRCAAAQPRREAAPPIAQMIFRQIPHDDLGCASYLIGDDDAGVAAVVDPKFEIDEYLELARYMGVSIEHILETHNHADHVSGHGKLAAATGAIDPHQPRGGRRVRARALRRRLGARARRAAR